MRENPKVYDPSYIKIYDEEAFNQEGAFCTKYVKKSDFSKSAPGLDSEIDQPKLQLSDLHQLSSTELNNLEIEQVNHIGLWDFIFLLHTKEQEEKAKNENAPRN